MAQGPSPAQTLSAWLHSTALGLMAGAMTVIASVSMAALIFVGDLSDYLGIGIRIALVTAVVTGLIVSLTSSCRFAISIPQDRAAPILAIMAATIVAGAPASAAKEDVIPTILLAIAATTLITGATLLLLGLTRAGNLIRFVPYSVLGGFFAGTGWLLVLGGIRVMTPLDLHTWEEMVALFEPAVLGRWLPGLAIALAIFGASRWISSAKALPIVLLAGAGMFFLTMFTNGANMRSLLQDGWLVGSLQGGSIDQAGFGVMDLLTRSNWSLVFDQWANVGTVVAIAALSIILTVSALEMLSGEDIDVHHEFRITGLANMAAGLAGGMVGFHSLSISGFAIRLGARHRFTAVVAGLTAAAALVLGADILNFLPRIVIGGLLLFIGLSFLARWLIGSWGRLSHSEYLVIPVILLTIGFFGFIEGFLVGLLAALIQFVVKYSRTPVIRYALSGETARSTVERGVDEEHCLARLGGHLYILKLRGYLFFGTAAQLSTRIKTRAEDRTQPSLEYVLVDFESVNGIDSSAAYEFHRIGQLALQRDFVIVLTGLSVELQEQLGIGKIFENNDHVQWQDSLDHGLEWYENRVLASHRQCQIADTQTALGHLRSRLDHGITAQDLLTYLSEMNFESGAELIRQGDSAREMYFLEEGEVSVYLQPASGERVRIRRTGPGTILGELGFYLGAPRTASVLADTPGKAYRLTAESLARMESEHPELAAALHRFIADLLAERLLRTTRTLEGVLA